MAVSRLPDQPQPLLRLLQHRQQIAPFVSERTDRTQRGSHLHPKSIDAMAMDLSVDLV